MSRLIWIAVLACLAMISCGPVVIVTGLGAALGNRSSDGSPAEPLRVALVEPFDGAVNVEPTGAVRVVFSHALDPDTASQSVLLLDDRNRPVPSTLVHSAPTTITIQPKVELDRARRYRVRAIDSVRSVSEQKLAASFSSTFTTRDGVWKAPEVIVSASDPTMGDAPLLVLDDSGRVTATWMFGGTQNRKFATSQRAASGVWAFRSFQTIPSFPGGLALESMDGWSDGALRLVATPSISTDGAVTVTLGNASTGRWGTFVQVAKANPDGLHFASRGNGEALLLSATRFENPMNLSACFLSDSRCSSSYAISTLSGKLPDQLVALSSANASAHIENGHVIAWAEKSVTQVRVRTSLLSASGPGTIVDLDTTSVARTASPRSPQVEGTAHGTAVAVWLSGNELRAAERTAAGWSARQAIPGTTGATGVFALGAVGDRLILAFEVQIGPGAHRIQAVERSQSGSWSNFAVIARRGVQRDSEARFVSDGNGSGFLLWSETSQDFLARYSTIAGWSAPLSVATNSRAGELVYGTGGRAFLGISGPGAVQLRVFE